MKKIFRNSAEKRIAIVVFFIILIMVFFTILNLIEKKRKERNERFHRELIENMGNLDRRLDTLRVKVGGSELLVKKYEITRFTFPYDIGEVIRSAERGYPIERINYMELIKEGLLYELTGKSVKSDSSMFY